MSELEKTPETDKVSPTYSPPSYQAVQPHGNEPTNQEPTSDQEPAHTTISKTKEAPRPITCSCGSREGTGETLYNLAIARMEAAEKGQLEHHANSHYLHGLEPK